MLPNDLVIEMLRGCKVSSVTFRYPVETKNIEHTLHLEKRGEPFARMVLTYKPWGGPTDYQAAQIVLTDAAELEKRIREEIIAEEFPPML